MLNDDQKNILPPKDNKPDAENFDITLLALLLRNVCGLKDRSNSVWTYPPPAADTSVEAYITRLRGCRNKVIT